MALHTKLDLSNRVNIERPCILLHKVLIDQRCCPQEEHCTLSLNEGLDQSGAVDELKKDETAVQNGTGTLMRHLVLTCHRGNCERHCEENGEDLEGYQLGESLIDIAFVAETESEILDWDQHCSHHCEHVILHVGLEDLPLVDLANEHH